MAAEIQFEKVDKQRTDIRKYHRDFVMLLCLDLLAGLELICNKETILVARHG